MGKACGVRGGGSHASNKGKFPLKCEDYDMKGEDYVRDKEKACGVRGGGRAHDSNQKSFQITRGSA